MKIELKIRKQDDGREVRDLLENEWLVPRKVRHFLRIRKNVFLNGKQIKFHETVTSGDTLVLLIDDEDYQTPQIARGNKKNLVILFEDEHLLIVNKPYGVKTHPNAPNENGTILNDIEDYLHKHHLHPFIVHRLDKETSGTLLFAKNPFVLPLLGRMMENKKIHRTYQAIVSGVVQPTIFTIDKKIGKDPKDKRKRKIDERRGKRSITHVEVQSTDSIAKVSNLLLTLETGRTHQIRVHLESIHHAILGDLLYSEVKAKRMMLHSKSISFYHPLTKEEIAIETEDGLF